MKAKRQRHQPAFKAKVGLEALAGVKTVAQIARGYQVHPAQVSQWKRAIVDRLPEVFEHGATAQAEASEREVARLGTCRTSERFWQDERLSDPGSSG